MTNAWSFKRATPGDRARESQVEKFFSSDAVKNRANAVVREGIQNSLDAALTGAPVHVRISFGEWRPEAAGERLERYAGGLFSHLAAKGVAGSVPNPPRSRDAFRYLVFEDFGTSGLLGDGAEWWPDENGTAGPFFKYFRAEGISGKGDGARGRHGVGRLVFMFASRARAMFGLTIRAVEGSARQLLMGTAVLRNHRVEGVPYLPDGWFGVSDDSQPGLVLPVSDPNVIERFREDFGLTRTTEPGLSIVVPWLSDEVDFNGAVDAVLSEYFYPVLSRRLSVEVIMGDRRVLVDHETIDSVVAQRPEAEARRLVPLLELTKAAIFCGNWRKLIAPQAGAPRWAQELIGEETAREIQAALDSEGRVFLDVPVVVRPKNRPEAESSFRLCFERDPGISESEIYFIREGIIISDARPRRTAGMRALVLVDQGALGQFLGDAENPSHTQWHKDMVKENYTFAPGLLDYVVQSLPNVLLHVGRRKSLPDSSLLLDLFSVSSQDGSLRPQKKKEIKSGREPEKPRPEVRKVLRRYSVARRATGFVVRRGDADAARPSVLTVRVAYDVRRGNPFKKFNTADFSIGDRGVEARCHQCEIVSTFPNAVVVRVTGDDFEFAIEGFDVSLRDLCIDVKAPRTDGSASGIDGGEG